MRAWSVGYTLSIYGRPQVVEDQHDIGWHATMGGMFIQVGLTNSLNTTRAWVYGPQGKCGWLCKVIRLIWHVACGMWHVAWDIWDHQNKWTHKEEILRKYQNMESFDCMIQIEHTRQPPDPCPPHYRQLFVRCNLRATLSLSNKLPLKRAAHYGGKRPTCLFLADSKLKRSINNNRTSISGWRPS